MLLPPILSRGYRGTLIFNLKKNLENSVLFLVGILNIFWLFFLLQGNVTLSVGDTVSFQIATNQRSGNLTARYCRLENPARPVRYKGIVSSLKDNFGFIERADVAKEIFFHFSETRITDAITVTDNVEFNIQSRNVCTFFFF